MGTQFSWFFDVAVIGIILVCVYLGGKKGFLKTAILLVGYLVAVFGGFIIAKAVSPYVYDNYLKSRTEKAVQENLKDFDMKKQIKDMFKEQNVGVEIPDSEIDRIINGGGDLSKGFADYAKKSDSTVNQADVQNKFSKVFNNDAILKNLKDRIPASIYSQMEEYLKSSKDSMNEIIKALNNPSKEESAKQVTELAVKPIVISVVQIVIFMITFTLLMILVRFIAQLFSKVKAVPVVGSANTLLGGGLGLLQGVFIVIVLALITRLIISVTNNDLIAINTPTIEETRIFKAFYNLNLFK